MAAFPARAAITRVPRHHLAFLNLHTGERTKVVYREEGELVRGALSEINRVLRDHRTDEVTDIDPTLLDQLVALRRTLGTAEPFHVISGYRSPKTNAKLARQSNGVAKKSMHMQGRAIDVRLPGIGVKNLYSTAREMRAGGAGLYSASKFVHLDTGRVRFWGR